MYHYHAFGLSIASDLPIREFLEAQSKDADLISIQHSTTRLSRPSPTYYIEGGTNRLFIQIPEVACFLIENGNSITYTPAPNVAHDTLRLFLLGSAMGALLQQRGLIVLHGNAMSWDQQKACIFVGHSGAGKSTHAAYCYRQGAAILTDDLCAIQFDESRHPVVLPGYPQLKLWQEAADLLGIATQSLRQVRPGYNKYALPIHAQFFNHPIVLSTITELCPSSKIEVTLTGVNKLKLLLTHSYRPSFLIAMQCEAAYQKKLLLLAEKIEAKQQPRLSL